MSVSTRPLSSPDHGFQKWSGVPVMACSIVGSSNGDKIVQEICYSEEFLTNPTAHLIRLLVKRGMKGDKVKEDSAMAFVIACLPKAVKEMTNPRYLFQFAETCVKNHQKSSKVTDVVKRILESNEYIKQLEKIQNFYEEKIFYKAERELRRALNIFQELKILDTYCGQDET